jgi:hypothetical protein
VPSVVEYSVAVEVSPSMILSCVNRGQRILPQSRPLIDDSAVLCHLLAHCFGVRLAATVATAQDVALPLPGQKEGCASQLSGAL